MGWNNNVKCTCNGKIAPRRGLISLSMKRIILIGWRRMDGKEILPPPIQIPWQYVFLFAKWLIRLKRNLLVFHNQATHSTLGTEIINRSSEYVLCALSLNNPPRQIDKIVSPFEVQRRCGQRFFLGRYIWYQSSRLDPQALICETNW